MNGLFTLEGKVAVVTGALGLLGREHCLALSEAGADVVVTDLDHERTNEFALTLPSAIGIGADITKKESVEALRDVILSRYGKIDILVNNAAVNDMFENPSEAFENSKFENYPLSSWQKALDVNVTGMFLTSQIIGTVMAGAGSGSIVNIASTYGIVAPDQSLYQNAEGKQRFYKSPVYPATKGAVISFTRFLAAYWGRKGVRVNSLSPGGVENSQDDWFVENYSKRTMLGRMAQPADYRGALLFLASDASSYVTGANLVVDGGWTAW